MKIVLEGWKGEGLRCPDHDIDVTQGGRAVKVALLQAENGTGKSTMHELLRVTLSGIAADWTEERVREFKPREVEQDEGRFTVRVRIDDEAVVFTLKLDFVEGRASYETTRASGGGLVKGWSPDPSIRKFLNTTFLKQFIFDGEYAGDVLGETTPNAPLESIDSLCQLYLFGHVSDAATVYYEEECKRQGGGAKKQQGLDNKRKALDKVKRHKVTLVNQRKTAQAEHDDNAKRLVQLKRVVEDFRAKHDEIQRAIREAESKKQSAEADQGAAAEQLMQLLRDPASIHQRWGEGVTELRQRLDVLRLPESTSKIFFDELVQEAECVCGREMNEEAKSEIRKRAAAYLADDVTAGLNEIKASIRDFVEGPDVVTPEAQVEARKQLRDAVNRVLKAQNEIDALKQEADKGAPGEIQEKIVQLKQLEIRQSGLGDLLQEMNRQPSGGENYDSNTTCLALVSGEINKREAEIARATATVELHKKKNLLIEILIEAQTDARTRIAEQLVSAVNQRLEQSLRLNPVTVERIAERIEIQGQKGVSAGQKLTIGISFLTALLQRGQNMFPLVIDSPGGALDTGVREEVGQLLPKACDQVVLLTTSGEREGLLKGLESGVESVEKDMRHMTTFRLVEATKPLLSQLKAADGVKFQENLNGVLVEGRQYFVDYQPTALNRD